MAWDVEVSEEFEVWWDGLNEAEQEDVAAVVILLEAKGPHLGFPHSLNVRSSQFGQMRELRIQHKGEPYRVLMLSIPAGWLCS